MAKYVDIDLVLGQGDSLYSDTFSEAFKTLEKARQYNGTAVFNAINALMESQLKMKRTMDTQDDFIRHQQGRICFLEKQLEKEKERSIQLEKHLMANNLVISGIKENGDEDIYRELEKLFSEDLQIQDTITIDIAHRLGEKRQNSTRPIVARLLHRKDKSKIFSKVKLLKGKPIHINPQLPDEIRTNQFLLRSEMKEIKNKEPTAKVVVSDEKLIVNGTVKRDMKRERSHCIDKDICSYEAGKRLDHKKTDVMRSGASCFQGHFIKMEDPALISSAMGLIVGSDESVAKATHNSYVFLPTQGHALLRDDGEQGAAKAILSVLQEKDIRGCLLVVTRWYFGHIGVKRFDAFKEAAKQAVVASQT